MKNKLYIIITAVMQYKAEVKKIMKECITELDRSIYRENVVIEKLENFLKESEVEE